MFIILLIHGFGWLQLTFYLVQSILWLVYLLMKPYKMEADVFIEIINEVILLFIGLRYIQLNYTTMEYSKEVEFGYFTIALVCLLILNNIIRWIYGIYLRIQKCFDQKNQAKVVDQEIELQNSNISEKPINFNDDEEIGEELKS